ncbi:MAG: 3-hexulose-6-phosphate synthase [Nitrospirota bacterium]
MVEYIMTLLQVALDCLKLGEALRISSEVEEYVDIIEVGTPLIKSEGLRTVEILKKVFMEKLIFADTKTMDVGDLEARMAFDAGADIMSVCSVAPRQTIKAAIEEGRKRDKKVMVDLLGAIDKIHTARDIMDMGPHYFCIHTGIDEQKAGMDPFKALESFSKKISTHFAVAGGIKPEDIIKIMHFSPSIIIVGGYITKAQDPKEAAKLLRAEIKGVEKK